MKKNLDVLLKECFETGDYEGYLNEAKNQYKSTGCENDKEELKKAEKYLNLYKEIQEIIKLEKKNSYEILRIKKETPISEIKRIFREKASKYHPNRAPIKGSQDAFRIIQDAFLTISTEEKKEEYDRKINTNRSRTYPYQNTQSSMFNNGRFVFNSSFRPGTMHNFEFTQQDIYDIYEHLYRNNVSNARRQTSTSTTTSGLSILVFILFFIFLNILS